MLNLLTGFDPLGIGTLIGSILFLGALVWVLVDNRSFYELNLKTLAPDEGRAVETTASSASLPGGSDRAEETLRSPETRGPATRRRAA